MIRPSRRAALLEPLETRRLLSAITLSTAGVLTVAGNSAASNTINVAENAAGTGITASVKSGNSTLTKNFTVAQVKKLVVNGGNLADTINVGQTGHAFAAPTQVNAGAGNDVIHTGAESDSINGGDGNDTIFAGAGNDLVHGGNGADVIHGGDGNDTLWGGAGNDILYGEAGNDTLGGILGTGNQGFGGAGKDTFVVSKTLAGSFPTNDFLAGTDVLKVASAEG
jgi:Ca2+-binding RTX toxin-like protein